MVLAGLDMGFVKDRVGYTHISALFSMASGIKKDKARTVSHLHSMIQALIHLGASSTQATISLRIALSTSFYLATSQAITSYQRERSPMVKRNTPHATFEYSTTTPSQRGLA